MAFEPGGYSDKLGNRHEGRWVVKQLLRLIKEHVRSVTIEAIGDDERGVDLIVESNSGILQFQQCKARNASREYWSVADLNSRDILQNMKFQLGRDKKHEFALVTGIPASVFGDICESARNSNGNPEDYYKFQIQDIGESRRETYKQFCEYLSLNQNELEDRAKAFDYLRRTYIILWPDDQNCYDDLIGWANMLVNGEPRSVVSCLAEYAQNNLRKRLLSNDVLNNLKGLGFNPRRLVHDDRLLPALEELQQCFDDSIASRLIGDELIAREETQELYKALEEGGLVILHGAAGYGKSGVLYELAKILKQEDRPYLPIRLDRQEPRNTARQFGLDMGLPESPVVCLQSLLGERTAVLILDQLDALRWTSSHLANSLEVCKAIVREARNLYGMGKAISTVLCCRTFDLEHDPEIKSWLESQNRQGKQCKKIEVKGLANEVLIKVIQKTGGNFDELTAKQRQILASAQHLAMWVTITRQGYKSNFQSSSQLMREFWKNRYQELGKTGVNEAEVDSALDILVNYMEQNGKVSAPASLISNRQEIRTELHTLGIIRTDDNKVTFCHQSYLDFKVADRLLREIHQGKGKVKDWLGSKEKQSLFRREQLRQVLMLLCDDSPTEFLSNIKELLESDNVRFHLKHLILEVISQIEKPSEQLCDYLLGLYADNYWESHIKETVFFRQPQYIRLLIDNGLISDALDSDNEEKRNSALWLLRSVAEKIPDSVTNILSPYIEKGDNWPQMILGSLCWNCKDDSEDMFELRLRLARMRIVKEFVYWKEFSEMYPMRALRLIEAVISTWNTPVLEDSSLSNRGRQSRLEQWGAEEIHALKTVATDNAFDTWELLMPHVERLTAVGCDRHDRALDDWLYHNLYHIDNGKASISRGIVELLCESGKRMASENADVFLQKTHKFHDSNSPVTHEILITSYTALPPEFANEAVNYLLEDTSRFSLGTGYNEPKWMPAVRLIEAHSPHCLESTFRELESSITYYHSPDEKRKAEYVLPGWREGWFGDYWGRTQYFLLPALYPKRRSKSTDSLIGMLKRKFGGYSKHHFLLGVRTQGGCVVSPLPSDKLHKISDEAWLGIINNKKIPENDSHKWKQIGTDHVAESAIIHFANDLRAIAKRYPERFGRLALRFPKDVHPMYVAAILDGVKATKPDNIPEEEKASWKPAKIETIEAILEKYSFGDERTIAENFCRLIRERSQENWSENAIDRLLDYAINHPDPEPGKLNVRCNRSSHEATVDDLVQNAINCVRGDAALAIGALLWEHTDWLGKLKPGVEHLANDPHPAVRVAALEAFLPMLNIDKDLTVSLFLQACKDDLRVSACRYAVYYFNCCIQSHTRELSPIVINMVNSNIDEVAEEGAKEVCARWLFHGLFEEELNRCKNGSIAHSKGIAEVASAFLTKEEHTEKCKDLLLPLFNDENADVRQKARHTFHNNVESLKISGIQSFIQKFIKSQAFRDDPTGILYTFKEYPESLESFADSIFTICEEFAGPLAELSRDISQGIGHDASEITPLLLRLYEQSKENNPDIADKCLGAWDILFENRIGYTRDMTKAIEQ